MFRTGQLAFVSKRYLNTTAKPTHLQKYVEAMSSHAATFPHGILESLQAETRQRFSDAFKMIPIHQAQLLYSFTRIIRPEHVLEIGTFTGMSTISIAAGTQGKITTIERDMEAITVAKTWLEKANMSEQVTIEEGTALDIIQRLPTGHSAPKFDLVFIDADKGNYINYFNQILSRSLLSDRGVMLVDNVLFRGLVPQIPEVPDEPKAKGLMRTARQLHIFNQHVKDDPRVEQIILPLYDGLSIIQKKSKMACIPSRM